MTEGIKGSESENKKCCCRKIGGSVGEGQTKKTEKTVKGIATEMTHEARNTLRTRGKVSR